MQVMQYCSSFVAYFSFSHTVDPINNPQPTSIPTEQEMYDIIMLAKDNDPDYTRDTFIIAPTVSEIPPGCESISDEYVV